MHKNTLQHFQRGGGKCPLLPMPAGAHAMNQGWARDVKARDRDETETRPRRDREVGFTSRDETETRR